LLTTGMHGIEHRILERRAHRLSAPLPVLFSHRPDQRFLARRSLSLLSSTGPVARNDLSLTCNNGRFHGHHSGVNAPGLFLRWLA